MIKSYVPDMVLIIFHKSLTWFIGDTLWIAIIIPILQIKELRWRRLRTIQDHIAKKCQSQAGRWVVFDRAPVTNCRIILQNDSTELRNSYMETNTWQ